MLCKGCGTCCRKGGPLLHHEDMPLAAQGHVPFTALVTLRRGELAHDPVAGRILPLEEEAVKIAGTGEADAPWHCVFHRAEGGCGIYAHRPAQCRALFCDDTAALEAMYANNRLTRRHLLPHAPATWPQGLAELVEAHEEQCPLHSLPFLAALAPADAAASATLLEAIRYDLAFRELTVERAHIPAQALPFLLGRPVADFLYTLGLKVVRQSTSDPTLALRRVGLSAYPA